MVEKNKVEKHVEDRKKKRKLDKGEDTNEATQGDGKSQKRKRDFFQQKPFSITHGSSSSRVKSDTLKEVFTDRS